MEFFFPLLGLAFLYLLSWIANIYLLVQLILRIRTKRKPQSWTVLWFLVWPLFLSGLLLFFISLDRPPSVVQAAGSIGTFFAPLLWIIAFFLFRKSVAKDKRQETFDQAEFESQYILDIRHHNDVWPPPPR